MRAPTFRPLRNHEAPVVALALLGLIFMNAIDVMEDRAQGLTISHYGPTVFMDALCAAVVVWLALRSCAFGQKIQSLQGELARSQNAGEELAASLREFRQESCVHIQGLAATIAKQMRQWGFSEAEGEVALLLLQGLSTKEIAFKRNVSDRTIRQQTVAIYEKSGLSGRAALSGFFLQGLAGPARAHDHAEPRC